MFQFIGFNFFSDGNCLDSPPSSVNNISKLKLTNGIYNHLNITKDTSFSFNNNDFDTTIPLDWTYNTVLNANFDGNLNGGNIGTFEEITSVKLKRREKGSFDWLTLTEIKPKSNTDNFSFIYNDNLVKNNTRYEYAYIPMQGEVEGDYIINEVLAKFDGVFINDTEFSYKLFYDVSYNGNTINQQVGIFEPLGKKYPVIVSNGLLSYEKGSVSASILNKDYENTNKLNREEIVNRIKIFKEFLTNGKAKMLRDWNGNMWLCTITGTPQINYLNGSGMGIPRISFDWVEIGDSSKQKDLYSSGMLNILK